MPDFHLSNQNIGAHLIQIWLCDACRQEGCKRQIYIIKQSKTVILELYHCSCTLGPVVCVMSIFVQIISCFDSRMMFWPAVEGHLFEVPMLHINADSSTPIIYRWLTKNMRCLGEMNWVYRAYTCIIVPIYIIISRCKRRSRWDITGL